jgi:hypothetical protein
VDGSFVATLLEAAAVGVWYSAWKAITEGKSLSPSLASILFTSFGLWRFFLTYLLTDVFPFSFQQNHGMILRWVICLPPFCPTPPLIFPLAHSPPSYDHALTFTQLTVLLTEQGTSPMYAGKLIMRFILDDAGSCFYSWAYDWRFTYYDGWWCGNGWVCYYLCSTHTHITAYYGSRHIQVNIERHNNFILNFDAYIHP